MEKDRQEATHKVRKKKRVDSDDIWYDDLDDDEIRPPRSKKKRPVPETDAARGTPARRKPRPDAAGGGPGRSDRSESTGADTPRRKTHSEPESGGMRRRKRSEQDSGIVGNETDSPSRRQAHDRKLKKQRGIKLLKRLGIAAAVIAVLVLLFIFLFRIKTVNMQGNTRYTKEEILELIHYDEQTHNTILFYLQNRNLKVEDIPFIDAIHIDIGGRDSINIQVVEKLIIGCIESGGQYVYFDTDGMICEIDGTRQTDVPLIDGLEFESLELNTELSVEDKSIYDALLSLTLLLNKHELTIDKVIFKEDSTMSMQMGDIQVLLGNSRNIEDKISELKNLLPQLDGLKGTLHLENYDSTKDSIVFTKE